MKGGAGWEFLDFKKMILEPNSKIRPEETFYLCLRNDDGEIISRRSKTYTANELKELNDPRYYVASTADADAKWYNNLSRDDNENGWGGGQKIQKIPKKGPFIQKAQIKQETRPLPSPLKKHPFSG